MKTNKHFSYSPYHSRLLIFLQLCFFFICISPLSSLAAGSVATIPIDNINPKQIDSTLAKLSDEQVRELLITELKKDQISTSQLEKNNVGLVARVSHWLHFLDEEDNFKQDNTNFFSRLTSVPGDYYAVAKTVGNGSFSGFILAILSIAAVFAAAWGAEFIICRFTTNFKKQFEANAIPVLDGPMRFIAGIMRAVPSFIHITAFVVVALLFFFILPINDYSPVRYTFLAILLIIVFYRLLSQILRIFLSPNSAALRVIPLNDKVAIAIHRACTFLCTYIFTVITFLALLQELNSNVISTDATAMFATVLLILMITYTIMQSRQYVRNHILETSEQNMTRNWIVEQFAQFWHVPTILFFFIIGAIMIEDLMNGVARDNSAFLMSLLFIPLFVSFNSLGNWVVRVSINTLRIYDHDKLPEDEKQKELIAEGKIREIKLYVTASRMVSLAILATLLLWVLNLWGVHIPYASHITQAVFESLIALALGLIVWRFASSYIEKKLAESAPEENEEENGDDEWGGAATQGRSYTILPMLRKFIACTLVVMVALVILSSMGIDIGPLLAGAGVVGLAIGFGAQKMVSDIFSGFFYLLDDAFRVGEFIKAGGSSGAVETITLRNVMLRHPRGMLQIVPHSELGSITNFMRGGIIGKFNLEFPYDADIDKIRKVVKKVGQAMLNEEEFKDDFINPVKSAGVREIKGSVMTIRVKFKVQPGSQFVIQREAYRRITEALAAQGVHYAHRKVIVELPEQHTLPLTEANRNILEAGGAAAVALEDAVAQEDAEKTKE